MFKGVPIVSPILKVKIARFGEDITLKLPIHLMNVMSSVD